MREGVTRRSVVSALGCLGLGAIAGGRGLAVSRGEGGATPKTPRDDRLAGSFWYKKGDGRLYTVAGGTGQPIAVNRILGNYPLSSSAFVVSRFGPRYLQLTQTAVIPSRAVINVYDHTDHRPYCHINVEGFVVGAAVSPSGKYVMFRRSPDYPQSLFGEGPQIQIVDLVIIDISDVDNIRAVRNTRTQKGAAVYGVQWLAGDRFVYMTWGDRLYGDSLYLGSVAGGSADDRLLGRIDKQGLRIARFNVHPDESSMLLSLFDRDGSTLGVWDVYAYTLKGQPIDRVTATGQGYGGIWSPDGNYIYFQYGNGNTCYGARCTATCSAHVIASSQRSVSLAATRELDGAKVPCFWGPAWRG